MPEKNIEQVQKEHYRQWMTIPGVESVAIGFMKDKPCIIVFSSIQADELLAKIPSKVDGYQVIIKQTGKFHASNNQ